MHYLISEAAKKVEVESHVLRYWEEELELPIRRNKLGHRYYTSEDIDRFIRIKQWKEQGLQLKAIRLLLKDGKLIPLGDNLQLPEQGELMEENVTEHAAEHAVERKEQGEVCVENGQEKKLRRMAELFKQALVQTMTEVNAAQTAELLAKQGEETRQAKEHVLKELDYQFRTLTEQNELQQKQEEEHYRNLDELIRKKQKKHLVQ